MDNQLVRACLAEFIGTFVLVFIGAASGTVTHLYGVMVPALAHSLIIVGLIYTYGHVSGAQFNPAVTIGLLVGGKQNIIKSASFIGMQFAGGIFGAFVLAALVPHTDVELVTSFFGEAGFNFGVTTGIMTNHYVWSSAIIEAILTFILVSAVFQAAVFGKAGNLAGVAIGFTLAACILGGNPLTGASLNPARTLGPALTAGDLSYVLPYFVGIFGGGILGGLFHAYILPSEV